MSQKLTIVDSLRAEYLKNIAIEAAYAQQQCPRLCEQIGQAKELLQNLQAEYTEHLETHNICMQAIEGHTEAMKVYYDLISL
jgi:hypothetical protein